MNKSVCLCLQSMLFFGFFLLTVLPGASAEQSGTFSGAWVASGQFSPFDFSGDREVGTYKLAGHVNLKGDVGEVQDFWADCVGLSDSDAGGAGRCVWRSLTGDKAYSVLRGQPLKEGTRVTGEFAGGTGRLKGITGSFFFTWISMYIEEDNNLFTGHAKDLSGSYQLP